MHDENTCSHCIGENTRIERLQKRAEDLRFKLEHSTNAVEMDNFSKALEEIEKECGEAVENLAQHLASAQS
ncbi:MAG: hypothetical protein Q8L72_01030 [Moraxellaceae bacterium]|jgi:hypothetical protein|nr:hypothetical protein [Moraxellaceae bacterium]